NHIAQIKVMILSEHLEAPRRSTPVCTHTHTHTRTRTHTHTHTHTHTRTHTHTQQMCEQEMCCVDVSVHIVPCRWAFMDPVYSMLRVLPWSPASWELLCILPPLLSLCH